MDCCVSGLYKVTDQGLVYVATPSIQFGISGGLSNYTSSVTLFFKHKLHVPCSLRELGRCHDYPFLDTRSIQLIPLDQSLVNLDSHTLPHDTASQCFQILPRHILNSKTKNNSQTRFISPESVVFKLGNPSSGN